MGVVTGEGNPISEHINTLLEQIDKTRLAVAIGNRVLALGNNIHPDIQRIIDEERAIHGEEAYRMTQERIHPPILGRGRGGGIE